jgi:hypothetical protein
MSDTPDVDADVYAPYRQEMMRAVFDSAGDLDPALRHAVFVRAAAPLLNDSEPDCPEGLPTLLCAFVDKVLRHAYKVTDADIERLKDAGYSEDAIFETIVSTAVGAGMFRIESGLAAMAQTETKEQN